MKNFSILALLLTLGVYSFARFETSSIIVDDKKSFEGVISFTKMAGSTESKYKYHVKGDKVRIEELNADGTIQGIMLVNTTKGTVIAVSPERKLYMDVPAKSGHSSTSVTIDKKETAKTVMTYSCKEWIATSKDEDRIISYWMAFDNFDFFIPFLKTINRKDKQSVYFLAMTGSAGAFPMVSVETKADGTELSRLTVTNISKKTLEDKIFNIPAGYTKM